MILHRGTLIKWENQTGGGLGRITERRQTDGGTMSTTDTLEQAVEVKDLTRRERVVLANLSEEATLEQIAAKLFVTRNTVKSQVRSVYRKIGVSTRADAVRWAREAGIQA
jgi:DNA-binding CsgD family transcriptional regulator